MPSQAPGVGLFEGRDEIQIAGCQCALDDRGQGIGVRWLDAVLGKQFEHYVAIRRGGAAFLEIMLPVA